MENTPTETGPRESATEPPPPDWKDAGARGEHFPLQKNFRQVPAQFRKSCVHFLLGSESLPFPVLLKHFGSSILDPNYPN